ncbi:methionyl-tRNA formyltransferase [Duganella sp. CF517]|uniref:formyltransferase family protein n=1 Tax=Duganella sp. CF517 TaxID=1881038 RepID=UPI0008B8EAA3|nr:formyltransferase family protein [Duganella sp. CF517]SEN33105.1 methionyl-tRNA formyltransferase [Duganella sp. CF517]
MNDADDDADEPERRQRAVVFAHGQLGVRCLKVLLAGGVDVALVLTHAGDPGQDDEPVRALCREERLRCITTDGAASPGLLEQIRATRPDLLFSFDYRRTLSPQLLALAPAYNMHASLLPEFAGGAPIERAVLHDAVVTGASLHELTGEPGAGAIVSQVEVPILPDDTAFDVAVKVVVAAEQTLWRVLPSLLDGSAPRLRNDAAADGGFDPRPPGDGRIDWRQPARQVYNLHRAAAPPYPGAFTDIAGVRYVIERARLSGNFGNVVALGLPAGLTVVDNCIFGVCGDGRMLTISRLTADGAPITAEQLQARLRTRP